MKYLFLIGLVIATTVAGAQSKTDWMSAGLKGKVKSVTQKSQYRYKKKGVFTPWDASYGSVTTFNAQGMRTRYEERLGNDSLSYLVVYTYDKKKNKADLAYFDKQLKPTVRKAYLYDAKGYKTEEIEYAKDSQISRRYVFTNDANGNMLTMTGYNADGKMTSKTTWKYDSRNKNTDYLVETPGYANSSRKFVYDEKGQIAEETWLNGQNEVEFRFLRTYDANGNKVQEIKYRGQDKLLDMIRWTYVYDAKGNWTKRTEFTSDGQDFDINERTIVYY